MKKKDGNLDMRYKLNRSTSTDTRGVVSNKLYAGGIKGTKAIPYQIQLYRIFQDIQSFKAAVIHAENIHYPNRTNLYRLYIDVIVDGQVSTVMTSRKNAILSRTFNVIGPNGEVDEEKTKLLKKKWFYDFLELSMDSVFWGHSLIEFDYKYNYYTGQRMDLDFEVVLVPREYVVPSYQIVTQAMGMIDGDNYTEAPYKYWNIPVGGEAANDLGLLHKIAPYYVWKKGALSSWAEFTEVFGVPMRVVKTDMTDEVTKQNAIVMIKNIGAGGGGIFDREDDIEVLESKNSNGEIFDAIIERCNSEISKLVLGQTGTTEEKAYVGSSEVHERVMHQYSQKDQIFIENLFNDKLLPFLILHGFPLQGCTIEIAEEEELTTKEKSDIDLALIKYGFVLDKEYLESTYGTKIVGIRDMQPNQNEDIKNDFDITNAKKKIPNGFSLYPKCHPNCNCNIVNGVWTFGDSKTGVCDWCRENGDRWNSKKQTTLK